jgi:hypothetical protein
MSSEGLGILRIGSKELMFDMTRANLRKNVLSISYRVYFYFGNLRVLGAQDDAIEAFRRCVDDVLGLGILTSRTEYPSVPVLALAEPEKREQIKARFSELLEKVASGAANMLINPS